MEEEEAISKIQKNYRIHKHNKHALWKSDPQPKQIRHTTAKNRKPMVILCGRGPGVRATDAYLKKRKNSSGQRRAVLFASGNQPFFRQLME